MGWVKFNLPRRSMTVDKRCHMGYLQYSYEMKAILYNEVVRGSEARRLPSITFGYESLPVSAGVKSRLLYQQRAAFPFLGKVWGE